MVDSKYSEGMVNQIVSSNKYLTRSPLQSTVDDGDTCHPINSSADTRSPPLPLLLSSVSLLLFSTQFYNWLVVIYLPVCSACLSLMYQYIVNTLDTFFSAFTYFWNSLLILISIFSFLSRFQNKQSLGNYHNRIIHVVYID